MVMKLTLPGIGYEQGGRQMVVTAMSPVALLKTVSPPDQWNPGATQPHGNRPVDKQHVKGIAEYLETEEHFVIGAVMLYATPGEASFVPSNQPGGDADEPSRAGTLYLDYGAAFDVGDGQHRLKGYDQVIQRHRDDGSPVLEKLRKSGQPLIVVIDDNPLHRAQDFTDLQRNTKKISASMGLSMDRRQSSNRLLMELIKDPALGIFGDNGDLTRIEFYSDTPSKLSHKLASYKAIRIVSGLVLGVNERTARATDQGLNEAAELPKSRDVLRSFWDALGNLEPYRDVITGKITTADLRARTYLASSQVLYAIAWAAHLAEGQGQTVPGFVASLSKVNFTRPQRVPSEQHPLTAEDTVFAGNLVESASGRIPSGRNVWESAAAQLLSKVAD